MAGMRQSVVRHVTTFSHGLLERVGRSSDLNCSPSPIVENGASNLRRGFEEQVREERREEFREMLKGLKGLKRWMVEKEIETIVLGEALRRTPPISDRTLF